MEEKADSHKKGKLIYIAFLLVLIAGGAAFFVYGVGSLLDYTRGATNQLNSSNSAIAVGWWPYDSASNSLVTWNLYVSSPRVNGSDTNQLYVQVDATLLTNQTYVFGLTTPYEVTNATASSVLGGEGTWSSHNSPGEGSVIILVVKENPPTGLGGIVAGALFDFKGLNYAYDHGEYTVFFPFNTGVVQDVTRLEPKNETFPLVGSADVNLNVDISLDYKVSSSSPSFNYSEPFKNFKTGQPLQQLAYHVRNLPTVWLTYVDTAASGRYELELTVGLASLGIGLPLLVSSVGEGLRYLLKIKL